MNEANQNSVRPEGKTPRRLLAAALSNIRTIVGGDRFENLYRAMVNEIRAIDGLADHNIRLLDYGCGVMSFSKRLCKEGIVTSFVGMDIFAPPAAAADPIWQHYHQLPEGGLSTVADRFDLAIVTDVLHHADATDQAPILRNLGTISRYILVKDHFEYSQWSRQLLRLADWYGNYAYGVNVPHHYFDQSTWQALVTQAGLQQIKLTKCVRVHQGLFGLIIPPRYHFIAILTRP